MHSPTEPTTATEPHTVDVDDLYRRYHHQLQRAVARAVTASPALIEDACQTAWMTLLRVQPDGHEIFAWLRIVAIREAYRLSSAERRPMHLDALDIADGWANVIGDTVTLDDRIEARSALRILAQLPDRQREDLSLHVAGYSYREIAELTGGRTFTNVNKSLARARARIRLARVSASGMDAAGANFGRIGSS